MAELGEANIGGRMVPAWLLNGNASAIDFFESTDYPGCIYRKLADGTIEWVNPPMVLGVEYRTTERFQGKPVYVKLVDFGAGANNTEKSVEHGASNAIVIDYGGYAKVDDGELSVPWKTHSTLSASDTVIVMTSNANYSRYSVYVWIKYYKTTD